MRCTRLTSDRPVKPATETGISNTDIVLFVLRDLGGIDRPVHIENIAEAAWQRVPARFSWPKLQKYPDLDAVDVTLRAAKKNEKLVGGSKRTGWMLTPAGLEHLFRREDMIRDFLTSLGSAGRTENRRERGGSESSKVRRLAQVNGSTAKAKFSAGNKEDISVHDFLAFFNINQYMPRHKYETNRQAIENLVRDDPELLSLTRYLDERFSDTYKETLQRGGASDAHA
jgi:hypothetical protein